MTKPNVDGWGSPVKSRKAHYFVEIQDYLTSLCGRWTWSDRRPLDRMMNDPGREECSMCARLMAKRIERKASGGR